MKNILSIIFAVAIAFTAAPAFAGDSDKKGCSKKSQAYSDAKAKGSQCEMKKSQSCSYVKSDDSNCGMKSDKKAGASKSKKEKSQ